ncbi:putative NACHT domain-containing protein [Seiridium cardinale]|uniref:NACHT domain-containing protein n=1 Tax=Seiridium cardinale TaxID=138064 RepID=A0ABR2Y5A5_9PEZI
MEERRHHIAQAYKHTYEWMLQPQGRAHEQWAGFARWARSRDENEKVYWIHGKPGSGKSTLMRFLYETIDGEKHLLPWGQGRPVVKIGHFFWAPGSPTQKSLPGLLRSILAPATTRSETISLTSYTTSSRPPTLNVFQDTFAEASQLRLELLTEKDIRQYIGGVLDAQRRFRQLRQSDPYTAENLAATIVQRASGVFLWVRLVVHQLLKALRDGDRVRELVRRVEDNPDDLDTYFTDLMHSIEPRHRVELLGVVARLLYEETAFNSLHPLRLLDLLYSEEGRDDFALNRINSGNALDFTDLRNMDFKLDSAL